MARIMSHNITKGDVVRIEDRLEGTVDELEVTGKRITHDSVFLTFEDGRECQFDYDAPLFVTSE